MSNKATQFKPGQSGNKNGRPPKGYSITEAFKSMFQAEPKKKLEIVNSIFDKARQGDPTAIKLVWNYMDGAPPQNINMNANVQGKFYVELPKRNMESTTQTSTSSRKNRV